MPRSSRPTAAARNSVARRAEPRATENDRLTEASILAEIRDAIIVTDAKGRITYWNDGAQTILGYRADEALGQTLDLVFAAQAAADPAVGHEFIGDRQAVGKDGSSTWLRLHARSLLGKDGVAVGGIAVATDVTGLKREELEHRRLAAAVEQSSESIIITDADGRIVYVNPAFEQQSGYSREEVLGENPRILKSGVQSATFYDAMWAAISNGLPWVADMTSRRKDGSLYQEEAIFSSIRDDDGTISGYVALKRDVTRERALEAEGTAAIRERALIAETLHHLPLGMAPEATGQAVCQQIVSLAGLTNAHFFLFAEDGLAVAIGLATADGRAGDRRRLPIERSRVLLERASGGPWVEDWADRPGHPYNQLLRTLQVRAHAYVPVRSNGRPIGLIIAGSSAPNATLVVSHAIPALLDFADVAETLLRSALVADSESGRARERVAAVIRDEAFHPVFQPIADLETRRAVGYEALTRFDDGTPPDVVFAEARRLGLERELEIATIAAALSAASDLPLDCFLSLNASPTLITGDDELAGLLATRVRPIVIEVTEHESIQDYSALRDALHRLGPDLRLAVDDAGAGVANFHHLVGLRPQFIKVDGGLVRDVNTDPARQALIVALLHFAAATDCRVIAEGIETEAELTVLRHLGVGLGQGYLLARPAIAPTFAERGRARPSRLQVVHSG